MFCHCHMGPLEFGYPLGVGIGSVSLRETLNVHKVLPELIRMCSSWQWCNIGWSHAGMIRSEEHEQGRKHDKC